MSSQRFAVIAASLALALSAGLPSAARAQGDSLRVAPAVVAAARLRGLPLVFNRWFGWVERVTVVDMIPREQSTETASDAEPNLAVNPADATHLVASAFTPNTTGSTSSAPVFVSTDGGSHWALRNIVPSSNGMTGDISLDFALRGNTLYTGILKGGWGLRMSILRTNDPFAGPTMTTLTDDSTRQSDQPFVTAMTTSVAGSDQDRVYVGFNAYDERLAYAGTGRTASADFSLDAATAAAPAGFTRDVVEARNTAEQDMPAVRFAVHPGGMVYGVFYRWASGNLPRARCDVIVVRDNTFATGTSPFTALQDASDGKAGRIVVSGSTVPAFPASLGLNRLVASNLSIAVSPLNPAQVWVAWADSDSHSFYTLHVRQSTDSGRTWPSDLLTVANATNPALAINSSGVVGFLYQRLTGTAPNQRWETHLQRTTTGATWSDLLLATTANSYLGDYLDLIALGRSFYGVFSAWNTPDPANFPQGVTYQRSADFTTHQLRDTLNTVNVPASVDPFFFKVEPPFILDICRIVPQLCRPVILEPGKLIIPVDTLGPVRVVDPVPNNCRVKWSCPGCNAALCPGYYHIFLDGVDPAVWRVQILGRHGELVHQQLSRTATGIILSFRPARENFRQQDIGDYYLTLESLRPMPKGRYTFATRLDVSPYPQSEYLRRLGSRAGPGE